MWLRRRTVKRRPASRCDESGTARWHSARICLMSAALPLVVVAALLTPSAAVAASGPPTTSVLIPSNGATVTGNTTLDASASNANSVEFLLFGGSFGFSGKVLCTATLTLYGWVCNWNTTTVPNGSYALVSDATNASGSSFGGVSIVVDNAPPTTSVLIPSNRATVTGSTTLDASASNANSVEFLLFGGSFGFSGKVLCTATLTLYGWVCNWNTTTVPNGSYTLVSDATNASGSSFGGVSIVVDNVPPTTSVLIPSNRATVTGSTTLDASASNANSVEFLLFGGSFGFSGKVLCTATLTLYGWVCNWNTTTVPTGSYTLVSDATNASGSSFGGVSITVYQVTNYSAPSIAGPSGITVGPDGALWFPNFGNGSIGRITTAGVVTNYTDPSIVNPGGITAGPDGALWFTNEGTGTETGAVGVSIGRITTAGVVTDYTDPSMAQPFEITAGPDHALWFTNLGNGSIGRITTAGVVTNYFDPDTDPTGITAGPDGALWFTNFQNNSIGRITTAGVFTTYTAPSISHPDNITAGPDGAMWFTNSAGNSIGRITTAGVVSNYTAASIDRPEAITAGPDGALWFNNELNNSIGRITTSGVVTNYAGPAIDVPGASVAGPDDALWFTNSGKQAIGRLTPP